MISSGFLKALRRYRAAWTSLLVSEAHVSLIISVRSSNNLWRMNKQHKIKDGKRVIWTHDYWIMMKPVTHHWWGAQCRGFYWEFYWLSYYVHCVYTMCTLCVHYVYVHCVYTMCTLCVHCVYTMCTLCVHYVYTVCALCVHCVHVT